MKQELIQAGRTRLVTAMRVSPSLFHILAHAGIDVSSATFEKVIAILYRFGSAKLTIYP